MLQRSKQILIQISDILRFPIPIMALMNFQRNNYLRVSMGNLHTIQFNLGGCDDDDDVLLSPARHTLRINQLSPFQNNRKRPQTSNEVASLYYRSRRECDSYRVSNNCPYVFLNNFSSRYRNYFQKTIYHCSYFNINRHICFYNALKVPHLRNRHDFEYNMYIPY